MSLLKRLFGKGARPRVQTTLALQVEALESRELLAGFSGHALPSPAFDHSRDHGGEHASSRHVEFNPPSQNRNDFRPNRDSDPAPRDYASRSPAPQMANPPVAYNTKPSGPIQSAAAPTITVIVFIPAAAPLAGPSTFVTESSQGPRSVSQSPTIVSAPPSRPSAVPAPRAPSLQPSAVALWIVDEQQPEIDSLLKVNATPVSEAAETHIVGSKVADGGSLQTAWDEAVRRLAAEGPEDVDLDDLIEQDLQAQLRRKSKLRSASPSRLSLALESSRDSTRNENVDRTPHLVDKRNASTESRTDGVVWRPEDDGLIELMASDRLNFAPHTAPNAAGTLVGVVPPGAAPTLQSGIGQYRALEEDAPAESSQDVASIVPAE